MRTEGGRDGPLRSGRCAASPEQGRAAGHPLELFFDLVFVFALTQVTGFLTHHLTWLGMLQGAALLAALWTASEGYSWLTNAVPAEEAILARLLIFCAMAAMFVASLAVPSAFGHYGVLFGVAYFVVQLLQAILYALATGLEPERRAVLRLAPGFLGAPAVLTRRIHPTPSPTAPLRTTWLSNFGFRHLATWLDHLRNLLTPRYACATQYSLGRFVQVSL
jgi:Bacterial low temperature requirement A protein (LtrA)